MTRTSPSALGLALLMPLAACGADPTQLIVVVDSDIPVPDRLDTIRVQAAIGAQEHAAAGILTADDGLPRMVALTHRGGELGPVDVTVTGLGDATVTARARSRFVEGERRTLWMWLDAGCAGVSCDDDESCERGACVPRPDATTAPWDGDLTPPERGDAGPPPDVDAGPEEKPCVERTFGAFVHLFCLDSRTWRDARTFCRELEQDLVIIRSIEQQAWIWTQITALDEADRDWWIGLSDADEDGVYEWVDGSGLRFEHFVDGQPDAPGMCGELDDSNRGRWGTDPCDETHAFVCLAGPSRL